MPSMIRPAQAAGFDFDQTIKTLAVASAQPPRELFYVPALALLGLIYMLQRRRRKTAKDARLAAKGEPA